LNFDSQKIFNQYENVNSIVTGMVTNQNLGNNINQLLQNIQEDIKGLKNALNNN